MKFIRIDAPRGTSAEWQQLLVPVGGWQVASSGGSGDPSDGYLDSKQVARMVGVSVDWVYRHKEELGGFPIGDGQKPRLRFRMNLVEAGIERRYHTKRSSTAQTSTPRKSRKKNRPDATDAGFAIPRVERR